MRSVPIPSSLLTAVSLLFLGASQLPESDPPASSKAQVAPVGMELLPVLQRARDTGPAGADLPLGIAVSMPYARPQEMQAFVDSVSHPGSPSYRQFITPEEVGERFGLPSSQVDSVADYLRQNGFTITLVSKNHLAILANATVAQAEAAFHTTIREYTLVPQDNVEPSRFIANSTPIQLPADLAPIVIDVSGLETYTRPKHLVTLLTPPLTRGLYNTVGLFNTGFTGAGRTIGISNWVGFRASNWLSYISHFNLPFPAGGAGTNIATIPCGGGGAGAGPDDPEGDLDVQMELGMAPLANIRIYDGTTNNLVAVLTQEVNDNLADALSESYGWSIGASLANAAHNQHLSMGAQGMTYMAASGDSGTSLEPYSYPDYEPEVLSVGGTVANVNSSTGVRISEVGWGGSGGGWSNNAAAFNVRPVWQTGTGVPAITGSNNHRLVPDVGFHSSGSGTGAYQFYTGGVLTGGYIGTSFASPILAGMLAVIEQNVISMGGLPPNGAGKRRFGRIQDLIYSQNGRSDIWHDILSGSNGTLPDGSSSTCHTGWDTVTGWGPMDCGAFAPVAACATGGACGLGPPFCAGDASDPNVSTLCPCFNFGAIGHGCANSSSSNGAVLNATGSANPDTVVLTSAEERPTAFSIFLQGNADASAGILFGAGVRCVNGTLKRLYTKAASGGVVSAPQGAEPSITARSAALGDPIPTGATRFYQVYYRDPDPTFCPVGTFNVSNGFIITWQ